jgi:coiled-coil domain-containing protein 130
MVPTEHEKKQKLETDAMFRLEHGEADRGALKKALPTLSHIQEAQNAWKDDFALNSLLRRRFRVSRPPRGPPLPLHLFLIVSVVATVA